MDAFANFTLAATAGGSVQSCVISEVDLLDK